MSDAHNQEHQSAIKTPKQLIAAVIAGFLVPIVCIVLLVQYVTNAERTGAGSNSQAPEAIAARIRPVADDGFTFKDPNVPKQLMAADAVYKATCAACHDIGAAGAPKFGDTAAWSARIAKGQDTLFEHAIKGFNAMPPKGGNPDLDDVEIQRAVVYMANKSGANFKEPEVPAAPAATTAQTPAAPEAPAQVAAATQAPGTASAQPTPTSPATATTPSADAGKKLYDTTCVACHGPGIAGAPKFGDKATWAPRVAQGNATLYEHAIKGFQGKAGMMPPKGGSTASDGEVKAAVDYMVAATK